MSDRAAFWRSCDWTMSDIDIARAAGVSRERVRQVRKKLGKPKIPHKLIAERDRRRERIRQLLEGAPNALLTSDVSRILGTRHETARADIVALGLQHLLGGRPMARMWKYDWDSVDWANMTNSEIAAALGIKGPNPIGQVWQARRRQQRPAGPNGNSRRVTWKGADNE